ncbi:MAG TPA: mechanosensitive ion channel [Aquaticitalea sp.]|nr:mechanosensitive ion channel [Aquaticitalea sp.]HNU60285.1 mechanosensitive ion channel [Aquaticitalea sp.]
MNGYAHFFCDYFTDLGLPDGVVTFMNMLCMFIILTLLIYIADYLTRKILLRAFTNFSNRSKTKFDDFLVSNKVPRNIAHLVPLFLTFQLFPIVFYDYPQFENFIIILLKIYAVFLFTWIFRSILKALESYFKTLPRLQDKPIDSYIQVVMLFVWAIGFGLCFVILTGIPLWTFFTTLGAASAILLLVFKDTILGLVASIQVSINDSVRIGDWITMDKYGADGTVIEINLSTVQVQNFDKTITHIPTYALLSDSYKNWRGMQNSGGRRIKRSILIKASSIHYLSDEAIEKLKGIESIREYLTQRQNDIETYNKSNNVDKSLFINGRNMTNFGVYRKYILTYVQNHSGINKDMTIMVRQLAPSPQGIPLEIYAFSSDKRWESYEYIMADIFDHALAAIPYFDLELFELSTFYPDSSTL